MFYQRLRDSSLVNVLSRSFTCLVIIDHTPKYLVQLTAKFIIQRLIPMRKMLTFLICAFFKLLLGPTGNIEEPFKGLLTCVIAESSGELEWWGKLSDNWLPFWRALSLSLSLLFFLNVSCYIFFSIVFSLLQLQPMDVQPLDIQQSNLEIVQTPPPSNAAANGDEDSWRVCSAVCRPLGYIYREREWLWRNVIPFLRA